MSIFTEERTHRIPSSKFNLSHEVQLTSKFGRITPILCMETLPGDKIKINTEQFIKFMPLVSPTMARMNSFIHYFFVPNRIVWDEFPDFIKPNGAPDDERPIPPHLVWDGFADDFPANLKDQVLHALMKESTLPDYLGMNFQHLNELPVGFKIPMIPIMAYHLIFMEYYQDQNLDKRDFKESFNFIFDEGNVKKTSQMSYGQFAVLLALLGCDVRAYEKDYFTSALPDTQAMGEVTLGSGVGHLNLKDTSFNAAITGLQGNSIMVDNGSGQLIIPSTTKNLGHQGGTGQLMSQIGKTNNVTDTVTFENSVKATIPVNGNARVDVFSQAEDTEFEVNPVSINELRRAIRLQEFLEKTLRGGKRYIEQMLSHWGILSSDARLDRPEFVGGSMSPVIISEQVATSASDLNILGQQSGQANSFGNSKRRKYTCEEHGWFFALWTCLPRTEYCQGMPRQFQRWDRFDYAWPSFAHLGEQEVKNSELYIGDDDKNDLPFGYQSRYAEYKYLPSRVCGDMKRSLDYWHLARKFNSRPTLSTPFIYPNPDGEDIQRIFTVQDTQDNSDYLICDFYHHINVRRKLPRYGTPML